MSETVRVEPTWPKGQWPTAEQWADWFVANPPEQRALIAQRALAAAQEAGDCFMRGHEYMAAELEQLRREVGQMRYQEFANPTTTASVGAPREDR